MAAKGDQSYPSNFEHLKPEGNAYNGETEKKSDQNMGGYNTETKYGNPQNISQHAHYPT